MWLNSHNFCADHRLNWTLTKILFIYCPISFTIGRLVQNYVQNRNLALFCVWHSSFRQHFIFFSPKSVSNFDFFAKKLKMSIDGIKWRHSNPPYRKIQLKLVYNPLRMACALLRIMVPMSIEVCRAAAKSAFLCSERQIKPAVFLMKLKSCYDSGG